MGYPFTEIYTLPELMKYINSDECNLSFFFIIENGQIIYESNYDVSIALIDLRTVKDDFDEKAYQGALDSAGGCIWRRGELCCLSK